MELSDIRINDELTVSNTYHLHEWRGQKVKVVGLTKRNGGNITIMDVNGDDYDGFKVDDFEPVQPKSTCWACSCGDQHLTGNHCNICGDSKPR